MTKGQSNTGGITYLKQTRRDCSTNFNEYKEKVWYQMHGRADAFGVIYWTKRWRTEKNQIGWEMWRMNWKNWQYKMTYILKFKKLESRSQKCRTFQGPDSVQEYWMKDLNNLHTRITLQLDRCLQKNNLPKWMVTGKTLLCVKKNWKRNSGVKF